MNVSPAKENILKKIRKALTSSTPLPFPESEGNSSVYQPSQQDLGLEFAERFTKLQGKFVFCQDSKELVAQLNQIIGVNKWDKVFCKEEGLRKTLDVDGEGHVEGAISEGVPPYDSNVTNHPAT